ILPLWAHTKPVGQAELVREILWEPISASPNTIRRELHWFTPPISAVRAMNYRTASSSTNKANCICMVHRVRPIIPQQAEHFRKYSTAALLLPLRVWASAMSTARISSSPNFLQRVPTSWHLPLSAEPEMMGSAPEPD